MGAVYLEAYDEVTGSPVLSSTIQQTRRSIGKSESVASTTISPRAKGREDVHQRVLPSAVVIQNED